MEKTGENYNSKIIVLVNAFTQSSGEFTTMAFGTIPNAKIIGSTTAGTDGNVTEIVLREEYLLGFQGLAFTILTAQKHSEKV